MGPERSAQRNEGARLATGSHLLFVDSDMVLEPSVVEDCAAATTSGAGAVIIPEVSFGEGFWAKCKALERSCYLGDDDIEAARFYARDLFVSLGGYDEQLSAGEDWDLSQRARAAGASIARVPSLIRHDEGRLRLSALITKKFHYGRSVPAYRRKHRGAARGQFRLLRPAFIRHRDKLAREPLTSVGMLGMKSLEFAAGAAGALMTLAPGRRGSRASAADVQGAARDPALDEYSRRHPHFATGQLPPLLAQAARPGVIAELGCGDGANLRALYRANLLGDRTYGVDISDIRVERATSIPGVTGIVADATSVPLPDESVDGLICSQVIEHVPDDQRLIGEIARLVRPGGWWYVGSCLRGPRAWWIYKRDGTRWLDPTHVREYRDEDEFRRTIRHEALEITFLQSRPMRYPVLDLLLRALRSDGHFYERHPSLVRLRGFRVRVPGYRLVEAVGIRRPQPVSDS
jgi:SAM-dependent methyltransferase